VLDLVFEHFQADRGFVLLRSGADGRTEPAVVRHRREPRSSNERRIMVSRTIVNHVLQHSQGVLSSNAMTDKRFSAGESVQAYGIRSAICVPIKFHDRIFGVIYIDSSIANYTYTEDQLRLMNAIGALTGMAMSNVELYQQGMANARLAAVGETVASLSHSIRNILQGMRGGAEVVELAMRRQDFNILTNGWTILSRNLDRIYELAMNMLAYSKQRQPEIELVRMCSLIEEIAALVRPQCDRREVALITECDAEMPPVPVDPGGLHQAVTNLLTNALDAVEPQTGVITLRAVYDADEDVVRITVSDNGEGIAVEDQQRIFQPFYSTKGQRGTGLGLAVTRKIVEEHGGRVTLNSEAGRGTSITMALSTQSGKDPSATNS
jgi:signal transduction histidine kinase